MSDSSEDSSYFQRLSKLKEAHEKLVEEKQNLLQRLEDSERLKLDLRETRRGAKNLANKRDRLRTLIDSKQRTQHGQLSHERQESSDSEDDCPVDQPPEHRNGGDPTTRGRELGPEMASNTEVSALRLENEKLVKQNRKLEQTVQSLVQELASLGNKYEGQNSLLRRLDAENQRLALAVNQQHTAQQSAESVPLEEVELLRAQLRTYEENFNTERSEREAVHTVKERLKQDLSDAKAAIRGYQEQLREVSAGRYISRPYDQGLARRDPCYGLPSSYYRYVDRDLLNNEMRRSYSGGYIGPSARDINARGTKPRRAFLTPDVTAVVDQDVPDGRSDSFPKSI